MIPALIGATVGAIGGIGAAWSSSAWEDRRTRRALAVERYRDGRDLLEEVACRAGERHFALQRWLWAIKDPGSTDIKKVRPAYFALLASWNQRTWSYRAKLRRLFGDSVALRFLDYADDHRDEPQSLHYMFVACHRLVRACESDLAGAAQAQTIVDQLNHAWSDFTDDVTAQLLERASELRLLDGPNGRSWSRRGFRVRRAIRS